MYAYIKGEVVRIRDDSLVLDNNGIGYRILVPSSVLESGIRKGDEVLLHTYFAVREDAMLLYGFLSEDDLEMFRLLLGVSGIGPKGALGVMSGLSADTLRFAVLSGDAATIAKAPGIGKKTAQKIILELKDKVDLEDAFEKKVSHTEERTQAGDDSPEREAVLALTALGYSNAQALKAVRKAASYTEEITVEKLLKAALREM